MLFVYSPMRTFWNGFGQPVKRALPSASRLRSLGNGCSKNVSSRSSSSEVGTTKSDAVFVLAAADGASSLHDGSSASVRREAAVASWNPRTIVRGYSIDAGGARPAAEASVEPTSRAGCRRLRSSRRERLRRAIPGRRFRRSRRMSSLRAPSWAALLCIAGKGAIARTSRSGAARLTRVGGLGLRGGARRVERRALVVAIVRSSDASASRIESSSCDSASSFSPRVVRGRRRSADAPAIGKGGRVAVASSLS